MVQQVKTCWLDLGWDMDGLEVTKSDSVLQVRWSKRKLYLIASTTCARLTLVRAGFRSFSRKGTLDLERKGIRLLAVLHCLLALMDLLRK